MDFASDERKIENEISQLFSQPQKKQPCAIDVKEILPHMVVNSRLRDKIGDGKKFDIYSKFLRNSSW